MNSMSERIARWKRLFESTEPGFLFQIKYDDERLPLPSPPAYWPDRVGERIDHALRLYETQLRRAEIVEDDALPYLSNLTGTEIFAEAFGCRVQRDEDKMPFALPAVRSAAEAERLRVPDPLDCSLAYLFDIADELSERTGPEALMRLVDIQSPMDITSLIWEKVSLFTALIETPEAVHRLSARVCDLLVAFMDEWFRRYGTRYIAHYPEYYMEGGITLSEDEIGTVSPAMFDAFFREELVRLAGHFGSLGMHCCANSRHQWDRIAELPGLTVLNLCRNDWTGQGFTVEESLGYFGPGVVQYPMGMRLQPDPVKWISTHGAGRRLIIEVPAADREEAVRLAGDLNEMRARGLGA